MKTYRIYRVIGSDKVEPVADGWNWLAFFFGPLWAMGQSLWGAGGLGCLGVFVVGAIVGTTFGIADTEPQIPMAVGALAVGAMFGRFGNRWWGGRLEKRGHLFAGEVQAESASAAASAFLASERKEVAGED